MFTRSIIAGALVLSSWSPVAAAQVVSRVVTPSVPVRVGPAAPVRLELSGSTALRLSPALTAPALSVTAAPSLSAPAAVLSAPQAAQAVSAQAAAAQAVPSAVAVPVAPEASALPAAAADAPAVTASAQLEQAQKLAAPEAQASPVAQSRWDAFWSGKKTSASGAVAAKPAASRASTLAKSAVMGGAVMSISPVAVGLDHVRTAVETVAPVSSGLGLASAAWIVGRWLANPIRKLGEKFGWEARTVATAETTLRAALIIGAIFLPFQFPVLGIMLSPYASAAGFLALTRGIDALIGRAFGPDAKPQTPGEKRKAVLELAIRAAVWVAGGGLAMEALGLPLDGLLTAAWGAVSPYTGAVLSIGATYGVNRALKWAIDKFGEKAGWEPNTRVVVRLIAGIAIWTGGIGLSLHAAGVTGKALLTTFGIGGIAVTMAAKDFIGNFMEAAKILLTHPFHVGDTIKIGDKTYKVKGLSLRYIELEKEPGTTTLMTYAQLSDKVITISRPYEAKTKRFFAGGIRPVSFSDVLRAAKPAGKVAKLDMGKAAVLAALGLVAVFGLPFAAATAGLPWLGVALPYLKAAAAAWATRWGVRWLTGLVGRLSDIGGWNEQASAIVTFIAQAVAWTLGGTVALHMAGITWASLMTVVGASSIAIGWASADIISNLIQGFWILMTQPFKIGDEVELGGVKGRVVDMSVYYVVLEHDGTDGQTAKSHTLVPYAAVKGSAFTVPARQEIK